VDHLLCAPPELQRLLRYTINSKKLHDLGWVEEMGWEEGIKSISTGTRNTPADMVMSTVPWWLALEHLTAEGRCGSHDGKSLLLALKNNNKKVVIVKRISEKGDTSYEPRSYADSN
jgi:hypothetical protein